jgi:hypothetical protein
VNVKGLRTLNIETGTMNPELGTVQSSRFNVQGKRGQQTAGGGKSMLRIAVPDLVSNSYFPIIAAVELGFFKSHGFDA